MDSQSYRVEGKRILVEVVSITAFDRSDEAFMIRIVNPAAMAGAAGIARYQPDFDAVV